MPTNKLNNNEIEQKQQKTKSTNYFHTMRRVILARREAYVILGFLNLNLRSDFALMTKPSRRAEIWLRMAIM